MADEGKGEGRVKVEVAGRIDTAFIKAPSGYLMILNMVHRLIISFLYFLLLSLYTFLKIKTKFTRV